MFTESQSETHCCSLGGLQVDCSILPSCRRYRPATRRAGGCGRCPESSSEVTSPWGRRCRGPAGLRAGSAAWWRTGPRGTEGPGPALSEPRSQTACNSLWTGYETLWEGLPRCLAVGQRAESQKTFTKITCYLYLFEKDYQFFWNFSCVLQISSFVLILFVPIDFWDSPMFSFFCFSKTSHFHSPIILKK